MAKKKKEYKPIKCGNCGTSFTPTRWWQKFCGSSCRFESWEKSNPRTSSKLAEEVGQLKDRVKSLEEKF